MAEFLSIPNWPKFRARGARLTVSTHPEDDYPAWHELSLFEQGVLCGIWRVTARTGRWCLNDQDYLRRSLSVRAGESSHLPAVVSRLIRGGFLVLCNEQNIPEIKKVLVLKPKPEPVPEPKPSHVKKFVRPSVEDVAAYMQEQEMDPEMAHNFVDFYGSKGWVVGKSPMKDWKAAVRTWKRQEIKRDKVFNLE